MTAHIVKPLLLIIAAAAMHVTMSSPNPPPAEEDRVRKSVPYLDYYVISKGAMMYKAISWTAAALEILVFLLTRSGSWKGTPALEAPPYVRAFCPAFTQATGLVDLSPAFMSAVGVLVLSALFRKLCYMTLGPLFTFELAVKEKHKLITTGPYAWVRHPSYTALTGAMMSGTVVFFGHDSYLYACALQSPVRALRSCSLFAGSAQPGVLTACGDALLRTTWLERLAGAAACLWIAIFGVAMDNTLRRLQLEDRALKNKFGKEWDQYAREVRWWLVPGVI